MLRNLPKVGERVLYTRTEEALECEVVGTSESHPLTPNDVPIQIRRLCDGVLAWCAVHDLCYLSPARPITDEYVPKAQYETIRAEVVLLRDASSKAEQYRDQRDAAVRLLAWREGTYKYYDEHLAIKDLMMVFDATWDYLRVMERQ